MLHNGAVMSRDKPGNVSENVGDCTFCSFLFHTNHREFQVCLKRSEPQTRTLLRRPPSQGLESDSSHRSLHQSEVDGKSLSWSLKFPGNPEKMGTESPQKPTWDGSSEGLQEVFSHEIRPTGCCCNGLLQISGRLVLIWVGKNGLLAANGYTMVHPCNKNSIFFRAK